MGPLMDTEERNPRVLGIALARGAIAGAAAAVALAKPLAVLLIRVLLFPGVYLGPLLMGLALGMVLLRTAPLPAAHDEDAGSTGS